MTVLASAVMAEAAVLLNDASQTLFTNTVLLPLLSKSNDELERELILNGIQVVKKVSAKFDIAAGTSTITLPTDFLAAIYLEEKADNAANSEYSKMTEVTDDPRVQESIYLNYWWFKTGAINFTPALTARDLQMTYFRILTPMASASTAIDIDSSKTYLAARVAELAAGHIGENPDRASVLNTDAQYALDKLIRVFVKRQQSTNSTRRRPYRASLKGR